MEIKKNIFCSVYDDSDRRYVTPTPHQSINKATGSINQTSVKPGPNGAASNLGGIRQEYS